MSRQLYRRRIIRACFEDRTTYHREGHKVYGDATIDTACRRPSHAEQDLLHLGLENQLVVGVVHHFPLEHLILVLQRFVVLLQLHDPAGASQRIDDGFIFGNGRIVPHAPRTSLLAELCKVPSRQPSHLSDKQRKPCLTCGVPYIRFSS